ncbi:MFSD2A [Branchiostoma lanceolatum]|nr:MFSD2A [Branchiostoma lanceolatum]
MVPFYMLEWYVPDVAPGGKIAYFVALYITESVLNSGVTLAHRTLVMHISDDSSDRESAIAFRSACGLIGMVVGVAVEGQIVVAFDGSLSGTCNHSNGSVNRTGSNVTSTSPLQTGRQEVGYLVAAGIICLLALIFATITLTTVRERTAFLQKKTAEPLRRSLKRLMTHKPSVCTFLLSLCFFLATHTFQQSLALYVQYSLGLGGQVQNCLLALVGSCLIGIPVFMVLMTKFDKKPISIGNILVLIPIVLGLLFVPGPNLVFALLLLAVFGMTYSLLFILPWMMLSDVSDILKLQTGRSYDTLLHGVLSTAQRITGAIAFGAISAALEIGGYESGDCAQPESVGRAIRWNVTILPITSLVLSLMVLWQYPITEEMRQRTKEALEQIRTTGEERLRQERKKKSDDNTADEVSEDVRRKQNRDGVENVGFSV